MYFFFRLYDGIVSLGTVAKHVTVIGSSFQYIQNNIMKANNENVYLTEKQMFNYEEALKETQKTLSLLKKELIQVKALSKRVGNYILYTEYILHIAYWNIIFINIG